MAVSSEPDQFNTPDHFLTSLYLTSTVIMLHKNEDVQLFEQNEDLLNAADTLPRLRGALCDITKVKLQ